MVKRAYKRLVFYISIFVILMAGVILIFCAREIRETTEQVDDEMNNNIDYAAMSCQNCLSDAIDILTVNYFTVQYMHESGYSMDEFRTYFTEQTDYLKNEESMQYLGIYGYIDGKSWMQERVNSILLIRPEALLRGRIPHLWEKNWTAYITERAHMRIMFQILIRNLRWRQKVLSAIRQTVHGYL